jgi:hypothetical protein
MMIRPGVLRPIPGVRLQPLWRCRFSCEPQVRLHRMITSIGCKPSISALTRRASTTTLRPSSVPQLKRHGFEGAATTYYRKRFLRCHRDGDQGPIPMAQFLSVGCSRRKIRNALCATGNPNYGLFLTCIQHGPGSFFKVLVSPTSDPAPTRKYPKPDG